MEAGLRRISINNLILKVNGVNPGEKVNIRIYPMNTALSEVRFWKNVIKNVINKVKRRKPDIKISISKVNQPRLDRYNLIAIG